MREYCKAQNLPVAFKPVRVEGPPTPVMIKMDVTESDIG
jgi:hypothetical protein